MLVGAAPTPDCGNLLAVALLLSSKGFRFEAVGGRGVLLGGRPLPFACTGMSRLTLLRPLLRCKKNPTKAFKVNVINAKQMPAGLMTCV